MSQDFAKHRQGAPEGRQKPARAATRNIEPAPSTHWTWFFSGIFCGFLVIGVGYIGIIKLDDEMNAAALAPAANGTDIRPSIDYGFYDELTNAQVEVDVAPAPGIENVNNTAIRSPEATQQITTDTRRYLVQAGAFPDRQSADSRRGRIALLNLSASISPGVVSGRTWYRVLVGPITGRQNVEAVQVVLSENNIDSYPLKMQE